MEIIPWNNPPMRQSQLCMQARRNNFGTILEQFWNNFVKVKYKSTSETLFSHGGSRTAGKLQTFHAKLWPGIVLQDHIPNLKIIAQTKEI